MVALIVVSVVIVVWALVEVLQADPASVRRMPRLAWGILTVFPFPPIGAIAWFFLGRPKVAVGASGQRSSGGSTLGRRQRYVSRPAPDDDPEFLRKLNAEAEHQRMIRRLEDGLNSPNPAGEPGEKDSDPRPRD